MNLMALENRAVLSYNAIAAQLTQKSTVLICFAAEA